MTSHSAKIHRGRFCLAPSLPMNRKLLSLSPWWGYRFFFLCVEKLQMLCSNSTHTTLHLAVGVKTPDCKCSWQLKQEAELQCLLLFLNSVLAAGQQAAPVCENCVFPGCSVVWKEKGKKSVNFEKASGGVKMLKSRVCVHSVLRLMHPWLFFLELFWLFGDTRWKISIVQRLSAVFLREILLSCFNCKF